MKHLRERQIIDIQGLAGDFLAALLTGDWFADGMSIRSHVSIEPRMNTDYTVRIKQ
jgi:hypothetical protein